MMKGVNITIELCCSILCLSFVFAILITDPSKTKLNRAFIGVLLSNIAVMLSDALAFWSIGKTQPVFFVLNYIGNYFCFFFSYVLIMAFSYYMTLFFSTKTRMKRTGLYAVLVIQGLAIVLSVVALFNGMYFVIDENNVYHRQGWYWLSQMLGMAGMLVNGVVIIAHRKLLNPTERFAYASYIVLPAIAIVIQTLVYGLVSVYIASTLSIIIIYLGIQAQQGQLLKEKELELTQSRISVMLSQIQPHFLYNSLVSISELCDIDPKEAKRLAIAFSRYLRRNMDSLEQTRPIPFEKEMEHVLTYLLFEKRRFEERLNLAYDIRVTDFFLPSLTIQPIVENAVRYGVTKKEDGGTVTIRTWETEGAFHVAVEDDGAGFDPSSPKKDGRSHIGLENVRNRLQAMVGGSLAVQSESQRGTTVTISIPKEGVKDAYHRG